MFGVWFPAKTNSSYLFIQFSSLQLNAQILIDRNSTCNFVNLNNYFTNWMFSTHYTHISIVFIVIIIIQFSLFECFRIKRQFHLVVWERRYFDASYSIPWNRWRQNEIAFLFYAIHFHEGERQHIVTIDFLARYNLMPHIVSGLVHSLKVIISRYFDSVIKYR